MGAVIDTPVVPDRDGVANTVGYRGRRALREARERGFRHDIQALRALAAMAVTLFHLWPAQITGGYVGVDVFFVISGYLITSHLLRELSRTGRIRLGAFWARRAKRLLPAALLTLLVTTAASLILLPPNAMAQTMRESLASIFYVQNWFLAASSVDYMAEDNIPSPVQHFWTLSVEEQFYVALPLILIIVSLLAARRALSASVVVLGVMTAVSFALSIWLTMWSPSEAYFSMFTRLWEFGVGGLVGLLPHLRRTRRLPPALAGIALILVAVFWFTPATPFPGWAAGLPVIGTALVLWAGVGTWVSAIGRLAVVAFLGRISYALYLWHWPPIVLLPYATGHPLTFPEKLAVLAGALIAAWLSTTMWEDRIRFSPRLLGSARPRVVAFWMVSAMLLTAVLPVTVLLLGARDAAARTASVESITAAAGSCFGAAGLMDPACDAGPPGSALVPAPQDAPGDLERRPECWASGEDRELRVCALGPEKGYERHVLVVGDSHAKALLAALELIAEDRNWRIDLAGRASCYWTAHDLLQKSPLLTEACTQWREDLADHIDKTTGLDAIITAKGRRALTDETSTADASAAFAEVVNGMASAWGARRDTGVPVIALVDNPRLPKTTVECVIAHEARAYEVCALPRADVFPPDGVVEAVVHAENAHAIDLTDLFCDADLCRPVIGGVVVYRDGRHVTDTYARTMAPYLAEEIERVLDALS